jgi:hypothetical protein
MVGWSWRVGVVVIEGRLRGNGGLVRRAWRVGWVVMVSWVIMESCLGGPWRVG